MLVNACLYEYVLLYSWYEELLYINVYLGGSRFSNVKHSIRYLF